MASCTIWSERLSVLRDDHLTLLTAAELDRRARYRRREDADRFSLGAVLLRIAAARTLGIPPGLVAVERTCATCGQQHGKPQIRGYALEVSVSHSASLVAVATTWAGPVGIDVEHVHDVDYLSLLPEVCAPAEAAEVHDECDFFVLWTRKESVVKASGAGLRTPIREVGVGPPRRPPEPGLGPAGSPNGVQLADVRIAPGYAATVCVLTGDAVQIVHRAGEALGGG